MRKKTREERIESALREAVEYIESHPAHKEKGLDYYCRLVKVGKSRLDSWKEALK